MPPLPHLHLQRCFHHAGREAVARCPECGRFYCRECVSEHAGRLLCASCLTRLTRAPVQRQRWWGAIVRGLAWCAAMVLAWLFFYSIAALLIDIPSDFHQFNLWNKDWLDS